MAPTNAAIAGILEEIADLLEIDDANPFRVRAYRNAARVIRDLGTEVTAMLAQGADLTELPGIGDDLAGKIAEIARLGRSTALTALRKASGAGLAALLRLPGLGPARVKVLRDRLHIRTVRQLERAARAGKLRDVPGFGAKIEQRVLEAVAAPDAHRTQLATAAQYAGPLAAWLRETPGVSDVVVCGSYRRRQETVGDLDLLVTATATAGRAVIDRFIRYGEVAAVVARGPTRAAVRLRSGLAVDLRVVKPESAGAALHYFTGSKAHTIALRTLAREQGLKINEYGVFRGTARIAGATEESVFASVGLPWIPPELREDRGEIAAAAAGRLPILVELADLRGDLHAHTKSTDGRNSLREIAFAAQEHGFEYLAITDHSSRTTIAHGLDPERLRAQLDAIDALQSELTGLTLLKGIEAEILRDGTLDVAADLGARLDLVVGAIHRPYGLSREAQTARIMRAMDDPRLTILAHPTGRIIGERPPYPLDLKQVIRHARDRGCFLELNAHPERLDLDDHATHLAKELGVLVSINSDAHSVYDFANLRFGVDQARRGWLTRGDVLNARPLRELRPLLARRAPGGAPEGAL